MTSKTIETELDLARGLIPRLERGREFWADHAPGCTEELVFSDAVIVVQGLVAALSRALEAEKPCWRCNGEGCIQEGSPEAWNYADCPDCGGKPFRPPPSTGGEGEEDHEGLVKEFFQQATTVQAKILRDILARHAWWKAEAQASIKREASPSPEMGEISRAELARIIDPEAWNGLNGPWNADSRWLSEDHRARCLNERQGYALAKADAILSKLKENGLSREGGDK